VAGQWFSPDTLISFTNKTDCHDGTEKLLEVALNTIPCYLPWRVLKFCNFCRKIMMSLTRVSLIVQQNFKSTIQENYFDHHYPGLTKPGLDSL
jgi:hypothetical protein